MMKGKKSTEVAFLRNSRSYFRRAGSPSIYGTVEKTVHDQYGMNPYESSLIYKKFSQAF